MKYLLIGFLRLYRLLISPLYGQVCRYHPSCSAYALEAVTLHGTLRGSWYAARRVASCHPWADGGYDPVPGSDAHRAMLADQEPVRDGSGPDLPSEPHPHRTLGA